MTTNLEQARSDRMSKGRIWVIVKKYKGHEDSGCMYTEMEALANITEVMQDVKKVRDAIIINHMVKLGKQLNMKYTGTKSTSMSGGQAFCRFYNLLAILSTIYNLKNGYF